MLLSKVLLTGAINTPWPIKIDGTSVEGSRFSFSPVCSTVCSGGKGKYYCSHGLAYLQRYIGKENLIVCGYVDNWTHIKKEHKSRLENRWVKEAKIYEWLDRIQNLRGVLTASEADSVTLGALHEVSRWARQVNVIAQKMIVRDKEAEFRVNFDAATREMKTLYKASSMLVDAFDYLDIFYNPSAAAFGKRRSVDLYKMVDKIRIILQEAEGSSQNKKIYINGGFRSTIDVYESFKIIPFCLLQNAIKYSLNSEIIIYFSEGTRDVELSVESAGPPITDEEREKIFERGYRGKYSKLLHHEGSGMGLNIAKTVADAHGFDIKVRSSSDGYQRDGIDVHKNVFTIKIPIGISSERRRTPR